MTGTRWRRVARLESVCHMQQVANLHTGPDFLQAFPDQRLLQGFPEVLTTTRQGIAHTFCIALLAQQQDIVSPHNQGAGGIAYRRCQRTHKTPCFLLY